MPSYSAPSARVRVLISTADRTKKAEVTLPLAMSVSDLVTTCKRNWLLPASEDFALRDTSRNIQLRSKDSLATAGLQDGAELEVYPLLEAGMGDV